MAEKPMECGRRTIGQLREHYDIERELADRLRNASGQERRNLYPRLYDEMYRRVPHHPQLTQKSSPRSQAAAVSSQMRFIKRFLGRCNTFLEVGPGDCALSLEAAKFVKKVCAVDVSDEITKGFMGPPNFHLILSDGSCLPVPANSVDVAYSNQLMEHLHPDDASEQLRSIYSALTPGGVYICITPNRLSGPHDISRYFEKVAAGFHLKEYTTSELSCLFGKVGFSRVKAYVGAKGWYFSFPLLPIALCEALLNRLPYSIRKTIARSLPLRLFLGTRLVAVK